MLKLIFLCRRRPDISRERYAELLLRGHVPLALEHHPAMQHYVVNIVEQSPAAEEKLDSVGELCFDTLEDFRERLYASEAGREIVERDVSSFMGCAHAYVTVEHVHREAARGVPFGERSPGVKMICPVQRRAGMTHEEFVDHWLRRHVPLALEHHPGLTGYVTNVVEQHLSGSGVEWDGFAELHFNEAQSRDPEIFASPAAEHIIREDMALFIGRTGAYRVAEYIEK